MINQLSYGTSSGFFTKCSGFFFTGTKIWLFHEYVISAASPQMQETTELKDVVSLLPSLQNGMYNAIFLPPL